MVAEGQRRTSARQEATLVTIENYAVREARFDGQRTAYMTFEKAIILALLKDKAEDDIKIVVDRSNQIHYTTRAIFA